MAKKVKVSRFSAGGEPSPNSGKYALFILAAIVLLLIGFVVGKSFSSRGEKADSRINTVKETPVGQVLSPYGPKKTEGLVPIGFTHSSKGAVAAAVAYVGVIPRLYVAENYAFATSISAISTEGFVNDFSEGLASNRANVRSIYAADPNAFFREIPLGYFVQSEEDDTMVINVWTTVMVVAQPDFNGKTESKIHQITLNWEDKDWKVAGWKTFPAPTPQWQTLSNAQVSVEDFITLTSEFTGGFDYAPSF